MYMLCVKIIAYDLEMHENENSEANNHWGLEGN